jgi:hypothetical protein
MSTPNHSEALVGIWWTYNPGGHFDETLVLFPDGTGAINYYNGGGPCGGRETFKWAVVDDQHLRFEGYINIFRVESVEFEIGDFVNPGGNKRKMLSIYPKGREARPEQFVKSDEPVESYEVPEVANEG